MISVQAVCTVAHALHLRVGKNRALALFLAAGVIGNAGSLVVLALTQPASCLYCSGASSAVAGLLVANLLLAALGAGQSRCIEFTRDCTGHSTPFDRCNLVWMGVSNIDKCKADARAASDLAIPLLHLFFTLRADLMYPPSGVGFWAHAIGAAVGASTVAWWWLSGSIF